MFRNGSLPIATLVALACAPSWTPGAAHAQSVNVDFNRSTGPGAGAPASSFGAACGQTGVWNAVTPSSAPNGQTVTLTSADGAGTVAMTHKASSGADSATFGSGDFSKLMADYAFGLTQNGAIELDFPSLEPGLYDVFLYTGLPQGEAFYTQFGQEVPHTAFIGVYLNGSQLVDAATTEGFVAPPSLVEGVNYCRMSVGIAAEDTLTISVNADLAYSLAKVALNGVQLRKWPNARVHVTTTGAGDGSGRDWANAMGSLHEAFAFADLTGAVEEIWIGGGTYKPALSGSTASFHLPTNGVAVRGGFAGTETAADGRTGDAITILSGNVGSVFTNVDNSFAVLRAESDWVSLDRLTVREGWADGTTPGDNLAGGLVATDSWISVSDCVFDANYGLASGAIHSTNSSISLTDCHIEGNEGATGGGAYFYEGPAGGAFVTISRTTFLDNSATATGGAVHWRSDHDSGFWNTLRLAFDECRFQGNGAGLFGGAVYAQGERAGFWTSLFNGNSALEGGAIAFSGEATGIVGCTVTSNHATQKTGGVAVTIASGVDRECYLGGTILWGNTSGQFIAPQYRQVRNTLGSDPSALIEAHHTCVQGDVTVFDGEGGSSADPLFVDIDGADGVAGTADDDLHLGGASPAIDSGLEYGGGGSVDLDAAPRKVDDPSVADTGDSNYSTFQVLYVDKGCYERQLTATCPGDLDGDGTVSAGDLAILLGAWGTSGTPDLNGDGTVGGADLAILIGAWGGCPA